MATTDRIKWFESCDNSMFCVHAINHLSGKYGISFVAWVILPEHVHWLIKPCKSDYSKIVFSFKRRVTARLRETIRTSEHLKIWQDRFWEHTVKNEKELALYVDYIHYNPVKHGYVSSPKEWRFSSFMDYVKRGYYDEDWSFCEDIKIAGDVFTE